MKELLSAGAGKSSSASKMAGLYLKPFFFNYVTLGGPNGREWGETFSMPYWKIYWNQNPGASIIHNGKEYELDETKVLLIAPNTPVTHKLYPNSEVKHFYIHTVCGYPYDGIKPRVFEMEVEKTPSFLIPMLVDEMRERGAAGMQLFSVQLKVQALVTAALSSVPADEWPTPLKDERISNIISKMTSEPEAEYDTGRLAAECSISENTFLRHFKKATGTSPRQFIIQCRLQKSAMLIDHTDMSIDMIADECGFCDRHYFSKQFSRHYGVGPGLFRRTRGNARARYNPPEVTLPIDLP